MFKLNRESNRLIKMESKTFKEMKFRERFDIQEWICNQTDILGEELLVIAKEILPGDIAGQKTKIRLDLLALDGVGRLVIIELKRDDSGEDTHWQAIKYAAICSTFSYKQILELLQTHQSISEEEAEKSIEEFVEDKTKINDSQRIILVSKEFHSNVISSVLWLRESGIDIKCVKIKPYVDSDNDLFITPEVIIPLPEAADYIEMRDSRQSKHSPANRISPFSMDIPDLTSEELKMRLIDSLTRDSLLTPRLIKFFEILTKQHQAISRDDMKQTLYDSGIGNDIGHSGQLLSNISQFVTKRTNPHLRQLLKFASEGGAGAIKDDYQIKPEYLPLVIEALHELPKSISSSPLTHTPPMQKISAQA